MYDVVNCPYYSSTCDAMGEARCDECEKNKECEVVTRRFDKGYIIGKPETGNEQSLLKGLLETMQRYPPIEFRELPVLKEIKKPNGDIFRYGYTIWSYRKEKTNE